MLSIVIKLGTNTESDIKRAGRGGAGEKGKEGERK
jgi:hypothetical protein